MTTPIWYRKGYVFLGASAILLFPLALHFFETGHSIEHAQSLCPFKLVTGFPCPGCGITKSLFFLYQGDLQKSLSYHWFGPLAFIGSLGAMVVLLLEQFTQKTYFRRYVYNHKVAVALAIVLGLYHIGRIVVFVATHSWSEIVRESVWG
ncbi:MAG: hypothetical protein CFE24_12115 [Flavobacterium sp. BFFFF2]|nr:MAG: hypothetical protein CFE24_12115 [Flavobacterium sp. BFFFF2]